MYFVADLLIRIKNASLANRKEVHMPYSNLGKAIAKVLVKEGFLTGVKEEIDGTRKELLLALRFEKRKPVVSGVEIISKPSLRVYMPTKDILRDQGRAMTSILSTSQGVLTGKDATKKGVGGELLFKIW